MMSTPHREPSSKSADEVESLPYKQFYHWLRTIVGILGILLPLGLVAGEAWLLNATKWEARGSLSEYYHSGMRDAFVSVLVVVGLLLITYKIPQWRDWTLYLSLFAGIAAISVAVVPTGIPCELREQVAEEREQVAEECEDRVKINLPSEAKARPTALQREIGEEKAEVWHFGSALGFIGALFLLSSNFAFREWKDRKKQDDRSVAQFLWLTRRAWILHMLTALSIAFGGIWALWLAARLNLDDVHWSLGEEHRILVGEIVATVAFGLSWLAKGAHWSVLFPRGWSWLKG